MTDPGKITRLLHAVRDGQEGALDQLVPLIYEDLRRIAHGVLRSRATGHTLTSTAVVHEVWLKLTKTESAEWADRQHFLSVAARAMRQVVVDYARERATAKRGGAQAHVELDEVAAVAVEPNPLVLAVDEALDRLAKHDERLARLVECRYFGGLTDEETAAVLGTSPRTVQRDWLRARAWLKLALAGEEPSGSSSNP